MTRFTDLIGCTLPLQLAGMGGVGTLELAEAVAGAGGLGMVPMFVSLPTSHRGLIGKNFLAVFQPSADEIANAAEAAEVVEFFYDWPRRDYVEIVKAGGALAAWQVGSVEEAEAAVEAGCDFVVAQGIEAGGHLRGASSVDDLLPAVLRRVKVPVLAAGGIGTARRVAELLAEGADGVRVGTRFVATRESAAHALYIDRLLEASAEDTVVTTHYGEDWPDAPHRVLRAALAEAEASGWRQTRPPARGDGDGAGAMAMYAGTGVGEVIRVMGAAEVVAELVADL
jgi:nitronate monooxygenase